MTEHHARRDPLVTLVVGDVLVFQILGQWLIEIELATIDRLEQRYPDTNAQR